MEDGRELELVEGTVASLIFQNEENGYTILRLEQGGEELTLVGEMPGVSPGSTCRCRGAGCATPPTAPSLRRRSWSAACPRA